MKIPLQRCEARKRVLSVLGCQRRRRRTAPQRLQLHCTVAKQRAERCWRGGGSALFRLHGIPVFFPLRRRHRVRLVGVRVWRSCGITQRGSACQSEAHGRGHESRRAVAASAPAAMTTLCAARGADCPLENGTTRAAAGTFSFPAVSGAVLVPAGFAPQPPPYMRGTQLVGQHGCGRTMSSARPPGCTGVSYNTKSFRRFDRRIRAAGETNPTCRGSPRLLKS